MYLLLEGIGRLKKFLRDFESIDKDISIRKAMGKNTEFLELPYKCIFDSDKDYLKRHSFMFDHKLCKYLIDPLIECAAAYLMIDTSIMKMTVRDYLHSCYRSQLSEFFPSDNCWYKYPDSEIDRTTNERKFISMGIAIYH